MINRLNSLNQLYQNYILNSKFQQLEHKHARSVYDLLYACCLSTTHNKVAIHYKHIMDTIGEDSEEELKDAIDELKTKKFIECHAEYPLCDFEFRDFPSTFTIVGI